MTGVTVGVMMHMPRNLMTALAAFALVVAGLVTATPAQAEWSRPGDLVRYKVCRAPANGGESWEFVSKVSKRPGSRDARAGIRLLSGNDVKARWSSGWLKKGETQISTVRVKKSKKVRVYIWQEAGDLDSELGTTATAQILKPKKIRRC